MIRSTMILLPLMMMMMVREVVSRSGDRLEVARCRAHCLAVFREECHHITGDCLSCWETCDHETEVCSTEHMCRDPGCSTACHWSNNINTLNTRPTSDVQVWDISSPLRINKCQVSWGKVHESDNSFKSSRKPVSRVSPNIYIVIGESRTGDWQELTQTHLRHHKLSTAAGWSELRLVVVGEEGVRLSSSVDMDHARGVCGHRTGELRPSITGSELEAEMVRVSLEWGESDEMTEYIVRWRQYPESGVVASLVTRVPAAQITLSPDTSYTLQLINTRTGDSSEPVIIDTKYVEIEDVSANIIIVSMVLVTVVLMLTVAAAVYRQYIRKKNSKQHLVVKNLNNNDMSSTEYSIVPLTLDFNNL